MELEDLVAQLRTEVKSCLNGTRGCSLRAEAKCPVPPEGNCRSDFWIVGRNPGSDEDDLGHPFIGPGGECLNRLLSMGGLRREDFWVTNLCKCKSKDDRPPYPGDVKSCFPWLDLEYQAMKPKVVCLLGNQVVRTFFPNALSVVHTHGQYRMGTPLEGLEGWQSVFWFMHHPGYVGRKGRKFEAEVALDWMKLSELKKELEKSSV